MAFRRIALPCPASSRVGIPTTARFAQGVRSSATERASRWRMRNSAFTRPGSLHASPSRYVVAVCGRTISVVYGLGRTRGRNGARPPRQERLRVLPGYPWRGGFPRRGASTDRRLLDGVPLARRAARAPARQRATGFVTRCTTSPASIAFTTPLSKLVAPPIRSDRRRRAQGGCIRVQTLSSTGRPARSRGTSASNPIGVGLYDEIVPSRPVRFDG